MARQLTIGDAIVTTREPFAPLLLTVVTAGIYGVVWWSKINREMRDLGENVAREIGRGRDRRWLVIVPPLVSVYHTARRTRSAPLAAVYATRINGDRPVSRERWRICSTAGDLPKEGPSCVPRWRLVA